jgi:hypothetical protein
MGSNGGFCLRPTAVMTSSTRKLGSVVLSNWASSSSKLPFPPAACSADGPEFAPHVQLVRSGEQPRKQAGEHPFRAHSQLIEIDGGCPLEQWVLEPYLQALQARVVLGAELQCEIGVDLGLRELSRLLLRALGLSWEALQPQQFRVARIGGRARNPRASGNIRAR